MLTQLPKVTAMLSLLAAAATDVPTVDIERTCRASAAAVVSEIGENAATFGNCVRQERAAYEQIVKTWGEYTAPSRQRCVDPKMYMPSYVEWLTCLEVERDARNMRKENPSNARGSQ